VPPDSKGWNADAGHNHAGDDGGHLPATTRHLQNTSAAAGVRLSVWVWGHGSRGSLIQSTLAPPCSGWKNSVHSTAQSVHAGSHSVPQQLLLQCGRLLLSARVGDVLSLERHLRELITC
jgi:hypothetical protein